eukprot:CAMPEP_0113934762 /NCGR_PEP_ID=MMETSP1339-20121228/2036_1 /TAXON_ID=94617 /ORGANISM="Fibrocapsa japonica" /LENGTH=762 /DNA_ID=CAMNT_0000936685 /DNA_START=111 /DNA_END=2399 /DNA_ORIENTATION=- /assembly_acc=CAM_ASM_000762
MDNGRQYVSMCQRIVVKAGTSTLSSGDGHVSLTRISAIVEQISELVHQGKQVILVSSGAVGLGRNMLQRATVLNSSMRQMVRGNSGVPEGHGSKHYDSACAAAGQLNLMSLYETLFRQLDISASQLLLTAADLETPERRQNVQYAVNTLLQLGIVPIVNENDAVSANQGYLPSGVFSDNDGLAAIIARELNAQLLVLLTDVDGVYDKPPDQADARIISTFHPDTKYEAGPKSSVGRGGMVAKVDSAQKAVEAGVQGVVIVNGSDPSAVTRVCRGEQIGTLFVGSGGMHVSPPSSIAGSRPNSPARISLNGGGSSGGTGGPGPVGGAGVMRAQAEAARAGGRAMLQLSSQERSQVLREVANQLLAHSSSILAANQQDLTIAKNGKVEKPLLNRLALSEAKLQTLADGINSLAETDEPVGRIISKMELSTGLELTQETVPIGVLLVIFESRPDSLPQIASLALRSGNGLLLKGGREAEHSNRALHRVIVDAVHSATGGKVSREVIGLVQSRSEVAELLKLDDVIDLVIPRGSGALVRSIKSGTRIPVLGHAEGICHVYVDKQADLKKAVALCVDSKTNYPAACNAAETILFHEDTVATGVANEVLRGLRQAGVQVLGGPLAISQGLVDARAPVETFKTEYGCNSVSVEVVKDQASAVAHIHRWGSGHTELIVTEDQQAADSFLRAVDSACVFHNASTRFSDGYRFGLGAEVGISTGRIHARGPVGVEGLLTTKWTLRSSSSDCVAEFSGNAENKKLYTHRKIDV